LSELLVGSYFTGIALSSSRLGVIHGIAHPLGALYDLPHGLICSVCFVPSIMINRDIAGKKYDQISKIVGIDFIKRVKNLLDDLDIKNPFKEREIIEKEKVIEATLKSGSTAANPKQINREDVEFMFNELFIKKTDSKR